MPSVISLYASARSSALSIFFCQKIWAALEDAAARVRLFSLLHIFFWHPAAKRARVYAGFPDCVLFAAGPAVVEAVAERD